MHASEHKQARKGARQQTWLTPPISVASVLLLACTVLLPLLGHRALTDWDEGIYAEIAREMLTGANWHAWLVPHWNGQLWFEKPPLAMWLTALSLRTFGVNAFAARLPSAVAGIGTVGLLHAWTQSRLDRLTAWTGSVILLSAFGFQHIARAGETDALLSLFCLLGTVGLAELMRGNARGWLVFWVGFGLALMTKGAASITLPLVAVLLAVTEPQRLLRFPRQFSLGLVLFGGLTVPWHLYLFAHFGAAFLREYLGFHVLQRATLAIEGHHTHPWFYLWVLTVSAPVFSWLYPVAVVNHLRKTADEPQQRRITLRAFAIFTLVVLSFFSAVRTRLPHYIAPFYPGMAVLVAALLASWWRSLAAWRRSWRLGLALSTVITYVFVAAVTAHARKALHSPFLPSGHATPDNREAAALLQTALRNHAPLPPGPLLVWRRDPETPVTTEAFYAQRLVETASLQPAAPDVAMDRYAPPPVPLRDALGAPRLLLMDKGLAGDLPTGCLLAPITTGPMLLVGVVHCGGSFSAPRALTGTGPSGTLM